MFDPSPSTPGTMSDWIAVLDRVETLAPVRKHSEQMLGILLARGGTRVIDVGCGVGHDLLRLHQRLESTGLVVGVDTSERLLTEARHRIPAARRRLAIADGRSLPFVDGSFDAAWVDRVLHWHEDPSPIVQELVRVVRPGGAVALTEPDLRTLTIQGIAGGRVRPLHPMRPGPFRFDATGLRQLLRSAGVEQIDCASCTATLSEGGGLPELLDLEALIRAGQRDGTLSPLDTFLQLTAVKQARRLGRLVVSLTGHTAIGNRSKQR